MAVIELTDSHVSSCLAMGWSNRVSPVLSLYVVLESSVEEHSKSRRSRGQGRRLTHIENGRNRAKQRGAVSGMKTTDGW